MLPISWIIYRYLANADFYNMYKPRGSEPGGGGQTYIDFPTLDVPVGRWEALLAGVPGVVREVRTQGPAWTVPIRSIGVAGEPQRVSIYQRRPQSVSVANQTLNRPQTNRVEAWHPRRGFPEPSRPSDRQQCPPGLAVFFAFVDNAVWAGWFKNAAGIASPAHPDVRGSLARLLVQPNGTGVIELTAPNVWLAENNVGQPFHPPPAGAPPSGVAPALPPIEPLLPEARESEVLQRKRVRATDARGYQLDPKRRRAVENYAMERAKDSYPGAEDTSSRESFDLRTYENGREVRVEVKGTLGGGEAILVTAREIENARGSAWRTDLLIVSDIQLTEHDGEIFASGGRTRVIRDWVPSANDVTATQYRYRVPD